MKNQECTKHVVPTSWALNPQQGASGSLVQSLSIRIRWQKLSGTPSSEYKQRRPYASRSFFPDNFPNNHADNHPGSTRYAPLYFQFLAEQSALMAAGVYASGKIYLHPQNHMENAFLTNTSVFLPLDSGIPAYWCGWLSGKMSAFSLLTPPLILQKHRFSRNRLIQLPEDAKNPLTFSPQWAFGGRVQTNNQMIEYPWNPNGRGFYLHGNQQQNKQLTPFFKQLNTLFKGYNEIELPRIYPGQTNSQPNSRLRKSELYKGWSSDQLPGKEWVPFPLLPQNGYNSGESIDKSSLCWHFFGFDPNSSLQTFLMPQIIIADFTLHRLDFQGNPPVINLTYIRSFALDNSQDYSIQCAQLLQDHQDVKVSINPGPAS